MGNLSGSRAKGLPLVAWYLVLEWSGWAYSGPEYESPIGEVVRGVDSGLVGLYFKINYMPGRKAKRVTVG